MGTGAGTEGETGGWYLRGSERKRQKITKAEEERREKTCFSTTQFKSPLLSGYVMGNACILATVY